MRELSSRQPNATDPRDLIRGVIQPKETDLGGFLVRRLLPAGQQRMVGPFAFFDHLGPVSFPPGEGIQVRPHPHIGLATVTYLFEGEIIHRDSLGYVQPIQPGAVNLMTAGRGIVHSERAGEDRERSSRLHAVQVWIALPIDQEECEPGFEHYPAPRIPELESGGVSRRLIMGDAEGLSSPVRTYSPTLYLEYRMPPGALVTLPDGYRERSLYVVAGKVRVGESVYAPGTMAVAASGAAVQMRSESDAHVLVVGGEPLGRRHVWWNFVSSSRERIERAKADWTEGRFSPVPGEKERIPLPE